MSRFVLSAFADEIDQDLKVQMDILEQLDISYIEVREINRKNITRYTSEQAREIKKQLDDRGFKISAIGSPIGKIMITDDFSPHLELFKHTMEIAGILDTKYIRMFSFYIPGGEDPLSYRDEVMNRWREFIKAAEGTELILLHENEKNIYGDTAERCLDLLQTMNCNYMKAVFDPANFVQCDVKTYPEAYEILKDYVAYMHIKDALYKDHSVVPSGLGDGKVEEILTDLYNKGFSGFLSIEPHLDSYEIPDYFKTSPKVRNIPEGGPRRFAVAAESLKKIIGNIERV